MIGTQNKSAPLASTKAKKPAPDCVLFDTEKQLYGDRCPKGYNKLNLLGKGGCAVVWLAQDQQTGQKVALK